MSEKQFAPESYEDWEGAMNGSKRTEQNLLGHTATNEHNAD